MRDEDLIKLETTIEDLVLDRESKNGNEYSAIVLPSGDWVFVWGGDWKEEIETYKHIYRGLDVYLYVADREDDPDDHFYNLKAVLPQDIDVTKRLFKAKKHARKNAKDDQEKTKEKAKEIYE